MTRPLSIPSKPTAYRQQRPAEQLRELLSASVAITSARSFPEILDAIVNQCRQVIRAEQAYIEVHALPNQSLHAFSGASPLLGFDLGRDALLLASIAQRAHKPVRLNRKELKSQALAHDVGLNDHFPGLRGWMAAPLVGRDGSVIGLLQLANKEHGQFREDDEFLLAQLAQFASVAVESARLYAESQRQLAERTGAEESMRLYRQIFASSNDAIAIVDPNGMYVEQNAAHRKLIGYSDEELCGRTPSIHLGEKDFEKIVEQLARSGSYHGELTSRTRSGETVDIDLSAFTMRNAAGEVQCHVGIKRDVTKRRRVEDEIRERVRQQAAVVELGERALAGSEPGPLMDLAVSLVAQTLEVDYCKILELLPDGQELLLRAGVGWKEGYVGTRKISSGLGSHSGFTLVSSEPVIIQDLRKETRFAEPLLQEHRVISGLSVIVEGSGRPYGVLGAYSKAPRPFTQNDVNFLQAVANVLATAIQRSRVDEALRHNQELLALAQGAANISTWEWDTETGKLKWSHGSVDLYGTPNSQLTNFTQWPELVHPDDREWVLETVNKAVNEGGHYDTEFRIIRRDGEVRWVTARGRAFRDCGGKSLRMIGINMDVTERKEAEKALRQSEERFRQAQRSANIGAYDWDLRSDFVTWSEELPVLKNLVPDGRSDTWLARIVPEDRKRVVQTLKKAIAQASDFDLEYRVAAPNGIVWLASRGQVFYEDGRPARILGVVLDISARVQAEELLRRSEKLAVVGRLAATIAHEINNPLESVTNLLYLLEHHPNLDDNARKYAQLAQQELHRVAHIARQTLSFHRETTTAIPVNLSELLDRVLQMHARRIANGNITVEKRYELDRKIAVFPAEIQQVISNLVTNALEALPSGGRLLIRLSPAVEWKNPHRRGVRLVVADNGPGIPRELRNRIFEPFFTTKGEKGTGLGLWVISGIVQKHSGTIRLRSNVTPGRSYSYFSTFIPAEARVSELSRKKKRANVQRTPLAA